MRSGLMAVAALTMAGVLGSTGPASADVWIGFPPNPVAPPPTEVVWLVQQAAPADVQVVFSRTPGPPTVTVPIPAPPGAPR